MSLATGVGSMPGDDLAEAMRIVLGEVGALPFVPELPARGAPAGMIGRAVGMLESMPADLQPAGWRLAPGTGVDQRRARTLLAQDLDTVEEQASTHRGPFKTQITGPLTLAATVERPRGDKVLADHGARRELAQSLAAGVGDHVRSLRRRLPGADVVVQVDEPAINPVLGGGIPTASGFSRHRSVHPPEADEMLRLLVDEVVAAGGRPVAHCCADDVPVALLAGAGFTAISFDLACARPVDAWAEAFEAGLDLWPGAVPSTDAPGLGDAEVVRAVMTFLERLGFAAPELGDRLVVTPTCGLAGASPSWSRTALSLARRSAEGLARG